jgi:hypothetical protein
MRATTLKAGALSAGLVAVVTVAVWQGIRQQRLGAEHRQRKANPETQVSGAPTAQQPAPQTATNVLLAAALAKAFDWRLVESEDYRKYIANLRAIGCPEETLRDIIKADIEKLFASRAKTIKAAAATKYEYWKPWGKAELYDQETLGKLKELDKERRAAFKELLGVEAPSNLDGMLISDRAERVLSFLPPDKLQRVVEINHDWAGRSDEAVKNRDYKEAARLSAEREAALNQVLTPEEKFEYALRESATARDLKNRLGSFEPTEQEYREIFRLRQQYEEACGATGTAVGTADYAERRQAALKDMGAQLRNLLGEQRAGDFEFEREWSLGSLQNLASQFDISKERYRQVFDIRMAAQEQADQLRALPALAPAQRQVALDAMRAETEQAIGGVLGQDLLPGYLRLAPWIQELNKPGHLPRK